MNAQEFLEAVRDYVADHGPSEYRAMLRDVDILVKEHYGLGADYLRCKLLGLVTGGEETTSLLTGKHSITMYPFAFETKQHFAMTLVHELAHVVTPNWAKAHGFVWAFNCGALGVLEVPYDDVPTSHPWKWTNPDLGEFVDTLPFDLPAKTTPKAP